VVFFLPLGTSLTFLYFFFFRGRFLDLDFGLDYEGKLGVGCFYLGNIIDIPFSFFFFRRCFLNLDFGLDYEGKLGEGCFCFFLPLEMSLMFLLLFFSRF